MSKTFFKEREQHHPSLEIPLSTLLEQLNFNQDGLIPAIAQQYDSKEVLMMAWMNKESILQTLSKKRICYWSRSRQELWYKGEQSGNIQHLKKMYTDCDGDVLLLSVDQIGGACHTGRDTCFYWEITEQHTKQKNFS